MRSYPCRVVGITKEGRLPYILENIGEGTELSLLQEPDNPYDPQAVAVYHGRRKIGYIPADKKWVWKSLEEGDTHIVTATDLEMNDDDEPSAIAIQIDILNDGNMPSTLKAATNKPLPGPKASSGGGWSKAIAIVALCGIGLVAFLQLQKTQFNHGSQAASTPNYANTGKSLCPQVMPISGKILKDWKGRGVVSNDDFARLTVREKAWQDAGNQVRVSIALAAFCIGHPDGMGTTLIRSHETDQVVMTVYNGNVSN